MLTQAVLEKPIGNGLIHNKHNLMQNIRVPETGDSDGDKPIAKSLPKSRKNWRKPFLRALTFELAKLLKYLVMLTQAVLEKPIGNGLIYNQHNLMQKIRVPETGDSDGENLSIYRYRNQERTRAFLRALIFELAKLLKYLVMLTQAVLEKPIGNGLIYNQHNLMQKIRVPETGDS